MFNFMGSAEGRLAEFHNENVREKYERVNFLAEQLQSFKTNNFDEKKTAMFIKNCTQDVLLCLDELMKYYQNDRNMMIHTEAQYMPQPKSFFDREPTASELMAEAKKIR